MYWRNRMRDPFKELIKKATMYARTQQVREEPSFISDDGKTMSYEYTIGENYNVTVTLKKIVTNEHNKDKIKDRVQYTKKFKCTCKHNSLFGNTNIPCAHIFAVIIHLGLKEIVSHKEVKRK